METDTEPPDSYCEPIVVGLGLVTLEFSRLEGTVQSLLAVLITPHQFVGEIAVSGVPIRQAFERLEALVQARIAEGPFRDDLLSWIASARQVAERRNGIVHSHWLPMATRMRIRVRQGALTHDFDDVEPAELFDLARRIWALADEGRLLRGDLGAAGFLGVTRVGDEGVERIPASGEYQIDVKPRPRPAKAPSWAPDTMYAHLQAPT